MTTPTSQSRRRYTVAIAKGSAAIGDIKTMLSYWTPEQTQEEFLQCIQQSGVLGKHTARRTSDLFREVFRPRLLTPDDRAARALKRFLEAGGDSQTFKEMLFLYEARAEDLLYDFTTLKFWPACRAGVLWMTPDDVLSFFDEAVQDGRLPKQWSSQVQIKIARGVLGALREFGFLREDKRGHREVVTYRVSDAGVAYLAHDLHFSGLSDAAVVEHPDWGLFGLGRNQVLERLDALSRSDGLIVQRAGSVVRITWTHATMESLIDAIA
jgi:hypothetical protein